MEPFLFREPQSGLGSGLGSGSELQVPHGEGLAGVGAEEGQQLLMESLLEGMQVAQAGAVVEGQLPSLEVQVDPHLFQPPTHTEQSLGLCEGPVLLTPPLHGPHTFPWAKAQAPLALH